MTGPKPSDSGQRGRRINANLTGDVTSADSTGINADSGAGTAHITSKGNINANGTGVFADGLKGATIHHTGDVTATDGNGIFARSDSGQATITSNGNINAFYNGITATADSNIAITVAGGTVTGGSGVGPWLLWRSNR